jgi:peptidoglycan hydrolase-like protein with peptidoglycan-binding domain
VSGRTVSGGAGCRALPGVIAVALLLAACTGTTPARIASLPTLPPTTAPPAPPSTTSPPTSTQPLPPGGVGRGDRGEQVRAVEARLDALHFDVGPVDGVFDDATTSAVQAFQKLAGLGRDGRVSQAVADRLATAQPPDPLVAGGGATRVEIDLRRQVLFLYEGDSLSKILPVSTGTGARFCARGHCGTAVTPAGAFRVDYFKPGWDESPLGRLYNPVYFDPKDGIAIHGYPQVPTDPASHGCVRIPMSAAEWLHTKLAKGTPVYVVDGTTPVAPLGPADPGAAGP